MRFRSLYRRQSQWIGSRRLDLDGMIDRGTPILTHSYCQSGGDALTDTDIDTVLGALGYEVRRNPSIGKNTGAAPRRANLRGAR